MPHQSACPCSLRWLPVARCAPRRLEDFHTRVHAARLNEAASHLSVHHLLRHAIRCAWAGLALIPKPKEQLQIAVHLPVVRTPRI